MPMANTSPVTGTPMATPTLLIRELQALSWYQNAALSEHLMRTHPRPHPHPSGATSTQPKKGHPLRGGYPVGSLHALWSLFEHLAGAKDAGEGVSCSLVTSGDADDTGDREEWRVVGTEVLQSEAITDT